MLVERSLLATQNGGEDSIAAQGAFLDDSDRE